MIAVDTNILVYAHRPDAPFHEAARRCVAQLAEGRGAWAIPWPCVHEFLSIVTRRRVFDPPTPLAGALEQVDAWCESPSLVLLAESPGYWPVLRDLLAGGRTVDDRPCDQPFAPPHSRGSSAGPVHQELQTTDISRVLK